MIDSNAVNETSAIYLPLPPCVESNLENRKFEMAVYARFMRHLRYSDRKSETVKVLEAIRFVADLMDHSDAHIAKVLSDLGLRAPRAAYPHTFLDFADNALACSAWELGAADTGLKALDAYWQGNGGMQVRISRTRDSLHDYEARNYVSAHIATTQ